MMGFMAGIVAGALFTIIILAVLASNPGDDE